MRELARRRDELDEFAFISYEPRKGIAERLKISPTRSFFGKTVDELWDAVNLDIDILVENLVGGKISDEADPLLYFSAGELIKPGFQFPFPQNDREVLGLCSCCKQADRLRHIPMLDFRAEAPTKTDTMARTLELIAKALIRNGAPDGVILCSGDSFHYYGLDPLDEIDWREFMLRSLLLEPLIDVRYIAHRLLSGKATLRITSSRSKPAMPYVAACLRRSGVWWSICTSDLHTETAALLETHNSSQLSEMQG
ncbi:MAG: hypothetical protein WA633_20645, partial [Stellaceae bacterium]